MGDDNVPLWDRDLPRGGHRRSARQAETPVAVYFPSCQGSLFGPTDGGAGVTAAFLDLCDRARVQVAVPDGIGAACCGTPWKSKGLDSGYAEMRDRVVPWLWEATHGGIFPVVSDATSCTEGLQVLLAGVETEFGRRPKVVDVTQFAVDHLMPFLTVPAPMPQIVLHPTCSSTRLGLDEALMTVARALADEVVVPQGWGCCGFAGDRGLLHPELTESATRAEAESVIAQDFAAYASCNRTCEIGMSRATAKPYRHLIELLAEAAVALGT